MQSPPLPGAASRGVSPSFVGRLVRYNDGGSDEVCEFRDMPPVGLTVSRTTETEAEEAENGVQVTIDGGPVLADDLGDFILSIEVPSVMVREYEVREEPPAGWPFREYWLPREVANAHRESLKVFISESGEEVPVPYRCPSPRSRSADQRGLRRRPGRGSLRVRERWRWSGVEEHQRAAFMSWATDHV